MSAAWIVLNRSSAIPAVSTLIRWGWNSASGAPNLSPPTRITRPSGNCAANYTNRQHYKYEFDWTRHITFHSQTTIAYIKIFYSIDIGQVIITRFSHFLTNPETFCVSINTWISVQSTCYTCKCQTLSSHAPHFLSNCHTAAESQLHFKICQWAKYFFRHK